MGQLSFWSADARPRALDDLEGLLCGPARLERFGRGAAVRLTVVLGRVPDPEPVDPEADIPAVDPDHEPHPDPDPSRNVDVDVDELAFLDLDHDELAARLGPRPPNPAADAGCRPAAPAPSLRTGADPVALWRAQAVRCALRARGVEAGIGWSGDGRPQVRTAFRVDLAELAHRWAGGGATRMLPPGFELDGPRLRLWVLASGCREGRAYTLGLDPDAPDTHDALLTASRRTGLVATPAGDAAAPTLRVTRPRARGRLVELVGARPRSAHDAVWPV